MRRDAHALAMVGQQILELLFLVVDPVLGIKLDLANRPIPHTLEHDKPRH